MDKLIKFFPVLPKKGQVGALIGSIAFYLFVPWIAALILDIVAGSLLSIIYAPLSVVVDLVKLAYMVMGIVFAVMSFAGHDFN